VAKNTNVAPYYDDYDPSKGFHRILYVPTRAVQARELTQMQSILQEQVKRFGNHIFNDGSMVIPGNTAVDTGYQFVKLLEQYNSADINVNNFSGKTIAGLSSGAIAEVIGVVPIVGSDPNTLYVNYKVGASTLSFTGNITSGSSTITSISVNAQNVFKVGAKITGSGIPSNSIITEILSSSSVKISNNASATTNGVSLTQTTAAVFEDDEDIVTIATSISDPIYNATTIASDATGKGSRAQIMLGVYYIGGFFVLVEPQTIVLDKYTNTPTYRVGLDVVETFVKESDDATLNDPARGSTNFSAPGAHRYAIELTLTKRTYEDTNDTDFVELFRIKNGVIQVNNSTVPDYAEIGKTLARRTYDESGDYTVRYFPIDVREHLDDGSNRGIYPSPDGDATKLAIGVEPGKAYVKGFEIEKIATEFVDLDKARDSAKANNSPIPVEFGSYVYITNVKGTFDVTGYDTVNLYQYAKADGSYPGSSQGTAKVRAFQYVSGTPGTTGAVYRLWLFDIQMTSGTFAANVKSVKGGGSPAGDGDLVLESSAAVLYEGAKNIAVFANPQSMIKTYEESGVTDTSYSVQRKFSGTMTTTTLTITAGTNELFRASSLLRWHVSVKTASGTATGNGIAAGDVININGSGNSIVLGGSPVGKQATITIPDISGSTIDVIATVAKTLGVEKTKALSTNTENGLTPSSGRVQLGKADIYRLIYVHDDSAGGADITSRYTLDNGQRDAYYDRGSIKLKTGAVAPAGNVSVQYEYFTHGSGDYFTVDSYDGVVDYEDIPSYTSSSGRVYPLRDSIDFRPRRNDAGSGWGSSTEFVAPGEDFTADFYYYLPRVDKLYLDSKGNFGIAKGTSDLFPLPPNPPQDAMVLYEITVPAYTLSPSDVQVKMIDNKRYTMRDIGKLEKRIENLEYYVALSLLEKETADLFIDDGTGVNRFKNGFVVDNFSTQLVAQGDSVFYQASIDPARGVMRPPFYVENVGLSYIPGSSSDVQKTGPLVTLPYTSTEFITQPRASITENVNPYNVVAWNGYVILDPASDEWYDTERLPDNVTYTDGNYNQVLAANQNSLGVQWNSWTTDWVGQSTSTTRTTGTSQVTTTATKVGQVRTGIRTEVVADVSRETVNDRVVNIGAVPYIRARTVSFVAKAMKPNTRVYPFFDNVAVASYVTPTGGSLGGALVTDRLGEVSGTFAIPNTATVRFRTGARLFRLINSSTNDTSEADTVGEATYTAAGVLETRQADVIATRNGRVVTTSVADSRVTEQIDTTSRPVSSSAVANGQNSSNRGGGYNDPIAQTFLIAEDGGCFLTKVRIYFQSKDSTVPITLQVRRTLNGYPTPNIMPFGEVTLAPSSVNVSDDASAYTEFVFEAPVYVSKGVEYSIVLLANSNNYLVWTAVIGQNDLDGRKISEQPYLGSFFKSQNASTWTAVQEQDMKFGIFKAVFDTGVQGEVIVKNNVLPSATLPNDPIATTSSSNVVTVTHKNHGLRTGDTITMSGVSGSLNNIPASEFNTTHTVSNVTLDTYTFTTSTNANVTGSGGGSAILVTYNRQVDLLNFITQEMILPDTSLSWGMKTTNSADTLDSEYTNIVSLENFVFNNPIFILSADNQPGGEKTWIASGLMESSNPNISPVLDLARLSLITVSNRINDLNTNETNANNGSALARYITKAITLDSAATSLQVRFAAVRPPEATIEVYVKYKPDGVDNVFDTFDWTSVPAVAAPSANDVEFRDYTYQLDSMTPYSIFAVKIVMRSSNTSRIPEIQDFRAIALGT
jgi:hypothetical protein